MILVLSYVVAKSLQAMATAQQVVSLAGLMQFFNEDMNAFRKGEVKFNSEFALDASLDDFEIAAKERGSMRDQSYKVGLNVDGSGRIASAFCECVRSNRLCSHMEATAIYSNKQGYSKTNLPNRWVALPGKAAGKHSGTKMMSDFLKQYWGMYQRLRLTASNFGWVLKQLNDMKTVDMHFQPLYSKDVKREYNTERRDAILRGQMHEEEALELYREKTGNIVMPSGLQLIPCGYLGCSPDGIIINNLGSGTCDALEIECPWKYRDSTLQDMMEKEKVFDKDLKTLSSTEACEINPEHEYWHQVQAEMAVLGAKWAHFFIWTKETIIISHVSKYDKWEEDCLPKLSNFYRNELFQSFYMKED